jgi:hypothetical protein
MHFFLKKNVCENYVLGLKMHAKWGKGTSASTLSPGIGLRLGLRAMLSCDPI